MFDPLPSIDPSLISPNLGRALHACEQALTPVFQASEFGAACHKLGNILQGMGRFEEATRWHTQAIALQPDFAEVYAGVGHIYVLQQHWPAAEHAYRQSLQHNRNYADAYWKLGAIAFKQDQRVQALHFWYHALALEPQKATVEGHIRLGHAFQKVREIDHATACYRRAIRLSPNQPDGYQALAEMLSQAGRLTEAIAVYQYATEQLPEAGWAFYRLGTALKQNGQLDEALTAFTQAKTHAPNFPWSHHDAIELLLSLSRWQEAIHWCRDAIEIDAFPWAHSQMGRALASLGKRKEAIAHHQIASELRGWHTCKQRDYQFTQDWFTHNIPLWENLLKEWMDQPHVRAIEIGSFQGMSMCWLLDHVLTHPNAQLTSIDPAVQPEFYINLEKTETPSKVIQKAGSSHDVLPTLPPETYDFVYIDGCHLASHVEQDGILSWSLVKPGGLLIFDDYLWTDPQYPGQDPKLGIDAFLETVRSHVQIVHRGYQIIAKKGSPSPC
ncbi:MAG: class I SAM-dependent methyltransferase [Cyanobacteria bacterium J06626_14]